MTTYLAIVRLVTDGTQHTDDMDRAFGDLAAMLSGMDDLGYSQITILSFDWEQPHDAFRKP